MFGLVKQEEVDLELSIAHYFFWRVVNISRQNAHEYCTAVAAADANQDSLEQSIQEFQWTQMTLLTKYNKIIDVLKNELDHKGLLRGVVESYDSRNIDPEVYSRWVKYKPGNETATSTNRQNHTKRKRSGNTDDEENDIMEINNHSNRISNLPTRKSRRVSGKQQDTNLDEIDVLLEENGFTPFASLQTKNMSTSFNVDENDSEFESDSSRKMSAHKQTSAKSAGNMEKLTANMLKKVDQQCRSMQLRVALKLKKQEDQMLIKQFKLEEKLKLQEDQMLIKQKKFKEEMKRKEEKLKKKEAERKLKELKLLKLKAKQKQLDVPVFKKMGVVTKIEPSWKEYFDQLVHFRTLYGNCRVTSDTDLGKWVYAQRRMKKSQSRNITTEQIELLNSIGFEWAIVNATPFETRVMNYIDLRKKDTTTDETHNDDVKEWINTTLEQYKSRLTVSDVKNVVFAERLTELALIKKMGGNINNRKSILSVLPRNSTLLTWISSIRSQYRLFKADEPHILTDDRRMLLEELGFNFTPLLNSSTQKYADTADTAIEIDESGDENDVNEQGDDNVIHGNDNNKISDGNDEHGTDYYESESDYDDSETEMDETIISVVTLVAGKKRSIKTTQTDTTSTTVDSDVVPVEEITFEE